jgi:hypothetical protein
VCRFPFRSHRLVKSKRRRVDLELMNKLFVNADLDDDDDDDDDDEFQLDSMPAERSTDSRNNTV